MEMVRLLTRLIHCDANQPSFTALRLVDNKAILYFDAPSTSDALTWFRGELNLLASFDSSR